MSTLELTTASSEALSVLEFRAAERASAPFSIDLWALCTEDSLDLSAIVGQPATFRATSGVAHAAQAGARTWSGVICRGEQVHAVPEGFAQANASTYLFRLVPRLWLLGMRQDNRIFQQVSIPDIVDEILGKWSVSHTWQIDRGRYPTLDHKVQYRESDLAFVTRLLEEAGIATVFTANDGGESVLTLSDDIAGGSPRQGGPLPYVDRPSQAAEQEFVTRLGYLREVRPGAVTLRDYDPRRPPLALFTAATPIPEDARGEQYHYDAGAFLVETGKAEGTPVADDRGFARHDPAYGKGLAERLLHGDRVGAHSVEFDSNAYDLAPGTIFSVSGHPHDKVPSSRRFLVLETLLTGKLQGEWTLSAVTVPADIPYHPPRVTPKPRIFGVQTARVVGPAGEEIHTDEFGRVRVELHWDRRGYRDQRSSCWVRVGQGWAGAGYGMISLPRIGQEVIVSFLEGDPDQPIIGGRVYNALEQVPYRLPEHKTRSTWKTDSSPGHGGFNEVMFEDLEGRELVWQQAQKDRTREVVNDEVATIGNDRQKLVKHDETEHTDGFRVRNVVGDADCVIKQDRREKIEKDSHVTVVGDDSQRVVGNQSLTVVENQQEKVDGRFALRAGQQLHTASDLFMGEAEDDVTLKGPGGFVRIDGEGITIVGTLVKINAGGAPRPGFGCKPEPPDPPIPDKVPAIAKLRWSQSEAAAGAAVQAIFRVRHFEGGETALVKVFASDADGGKRPVDELSAPVPLTDGDVTVTWTRSPQEAAQDVAPDADPDIEPLEYTFEVESGQVRAGEASGPLRLTGAGA